MKKRRMTAAFLAAALGVTALTGCGGTGGSTDTGKSTEAEKISTTITVWGCAEDQADENGKWLQTMCEKFNIRNGILHLNTVSAPNRMPERPFRRIRVIQPTYISLQMTSYRH